jgi:hypothetical protein
VGVTIFNEHTAPTLRVPVLARYFGSPPSCERLKYNAPDAIVLLADTIMQRVSENWAKNQIDGGLVTVLSGNASEEISRQTRNY